jgi:hypothetical protein
LIGPDGVLTSPRLCIIPTKPDAGTECSQNVRRYAFKRLLVLSKVPFAGCSLLNQRGYLLSETNFFWSILAAAYKYKPPSLKLTWQRDIASK